MNTFLDYVYKIVESTIPTKNQIISQERVEKYARIIGIHVFSFENVGINKLISIIVISSETKIDLRFKREIIKLRNYLLANGFAIIVIYDEEVENRTNDLGVFLSEQFKLFSPNYLCLPCVRDMNYRTTINGLQYIELKRMLKQFYKGCIVFIAPRKGWQKVNLEIIKDTCPECNAKIRMVTGIVFPNKQLASWNNASWKYYNTLITISTLPKKYIKILKPIIINLRKLRNKITPLIYYQDVIAEEDYWTVACPCCGMAIDQYYPDDKRTGYLQTLNSRINHNLEYHTIRLSVDQELANLLDESSEFNPHTCIAGWKQINNK